MLSLLLKIEIGSVGCLKGCFTGLGLNLFFFFFFKSRQETADKGLPWMVDKWFLLYWSSGALVNFSN